MVVVHHLEGISFQVYFCLVFFSQSRWGDASPLTRQQGIYTCERVSKLTFFFAPHFEVAEGALSHCWT